MKPKAFTALVSTALLIMTAASASGQPDTLRVLGGSGAPGISDSTITVELVNNSFEVGGFAVTVDFDSSVFKFSADELADPTLAVTPGNRTTGFETFGASIDTLHGKVTVVATTDLFPPPNPPAPIGVGPIAIIKLDVAPDAAPGNYWISITGSISNAAGTQQVSPDTAGGLFVVTTPAPELDLPDTLEFDEDERGSLSLSAHLSHPSVPLAELTLDITSDEPELNWGVSVADDRLDAWGAPDFFGQGRLFMQVTDPSMNVVGDTMLVLVHAVNDSPRVAALTDTTINENQEIAFQVKGSDVDEDPLSYAAGGLPLGAVFDPVTAMFTWTPTFEQGEVGGKPYVVGFEVSDGTISVEVSRTISVKDVNRAPDEAPQLAHPAQDEQVNLSAAVFEWSATTDPDGDAISYEIQFSTNPDFSSGVQSATGLTGTSVAYGSLPEVVRNHIQGDGLYHWRVRADDGRGGNSPWSATWEFTVSGGILTRIELASFSAAVVRERIELSWLIGAMDEMANLVLYRSQNAEGEATPIHMEAARARAQFSFIDSDIEAGQAYHYTLKAEDNVGRSRVLGEVDAQAAVPQVFALTQNFPNPMTGAPDAGTTIYFELPRRSEVSIKVYDLMGRLVHTLARGEWNAGYHSIAWKGRDLEGRALPTGIYVYVMEAGEFRSVKKLTLVR